jgi:hypothetical protein
VNEMQRVKKIAEKVRKAVEELAKHEAALNKEGGNDSVTLCGYCARASSVLSNALAEEGIEHKIGVAAHHVFVLWKEYVVDVTATQFGEGPVIIETKAGIDCKRRRHNWEVCDILNDSKELEAYQKKWNFPVEQSNQEYDMRFYEGLK